MTQRRRVLAMLLLLFAITYLDRVCISVAGPRMQEELHIGAVGWSWVTAIFNLSYGLFEIPSGVLGDRMGARRVLTRIVLWWSAFTALTGRVSNTVLLLVTRFSFGAGEAGVFPNSSIVVSRWFPPTQRASISGFNLAAAQVGGAVAPLLVVPIQARFGWRASFYVFALAGVIWAGVWYAWFRDSPAEKSGVSEEGLRVDAGRHSGHGAGFPWRAALRSESLLALLVTALCYVYVYNFFQTWFHTFLVKGRGFKESGLLLSSLPYVVAACANLTGGALSDALVLKMGSKWGRRAIGLAGLGCACLSIIAAAISRQQVMTVVFLSIAYGAITFQQSVVFGVCLDIGHEHAGAMVGLMNTASQIGGLLGTVAYGYIVDFFGSYNAPFLPMAALLLVGMLLWFRIDASKKLA